LVKLYADEDGHDLVRSIAVPIVVSALARVEVPAAIWRKHRSGELDREDALVLVRTFAADYAGIGDAPARFLAVRVADQLLERAASLTGESGLRVYDAVQLASALAACQIDERCATFATFDHDLTAAAAAQGFETLP
jgi:predicted nucleic acid-binding protein